MKPVLTVSIRTVADRAGVSPATVSNVLRGKPTVAPQFVERVRAAAEDLGYTADNNASRLRSGQHSLAAVVVPDLSNPMFGSFVSTLERLARDDGFDLLVVSSANDPAQEAERLRAIRSWRPAGLIVIPCDSAVFARMPRGWHAPVVVADRIPDEAACDLVAVDNGRAAGGLVAHLAEQGHASCLVAGSTRAISNIRERWEGAVGAAGPMAVTMLEVSLDPDTMRRRLRTELKRRRPAALFTLDHITTLVAYRLLRELDLAIPDDVAFASFDDAEWMSLVTPGITAICQPVEAMAAASWRQLIRRIQGDASGPAILRLPCATEIRGSTLRPQRQPTSAAA